MTQVFSVLKQNALVKRHDKIRLQLRVFKALQTFLSRKRHLINQNIQTLRFCAENKFSTMAAVFDALKKNAIDKKYDLMRDAVVNELDVEIASHSEFNSSVAKRMSHKQLTRASEILCLALGQNLQSYFIKWKLHSIGFKINLNTNLKEKMFRLYKGRLQTHFDHWKLHLKTKQIRAKKKMVMAMQAESQGLQEIN